MMDLLQQLDELCAKKKALTDQYDKLHEEKEQATKMTLRIWERVARNINKRFQEGNLFNDWQLADSGYTDHNLCVLQKGSIKLLIHFHWNKDHFCVTGSVVYFGPGTTWRREIKGSEPIKGLTEGLSVSEVFVQRFLPLIFAKQEVMQALTHESESVRQLAKLYIETKKEEKNAISASAT